MTGTLKMLRGKVFSQNQVDMLNEKIRTLKNEIESIQKSCQHDFWLLENLPRMEKTPYEDAYFGWIEHSRCDEEQISFLVRCVKCNLEETFLITKMCPFCLVAMGGGEIEYLTKFTKSHHDLYSKVYVHKCRSCRIIIIQRKFW